MRRRGLVRPVRAGARLSRPGSAVRKSGVEAWCERGVECVSCERGVECVLRQHGVECVSWRCGVECVLWRRWAECFVADAWGVECAS